MSDAITRGRKALQRIHKKNVEADFVYGTMGRLVAGVATFDVTGRAGFVFVTIKQSSGAQTSPPARNDAGVPLALGLPVRMRLEAGILVIDGIAKRSDLAYTSPGQDVDIHTHDNRYFTETEHLNVSAGAADAGKPVKLDAGGHIDVTMLNGADIAAKIHAATLDTAPLDADEVPTLDSSASFALLRTTWTTIKAFLKTYFDGIYARLATANEFTAINTFNEGIEVRQTGTGPLVEISTLTITEGASVLRTGFSGAGTAVFMNMVRSAATGTMMGAGVTGDTQRRITVQADGKILWGSGAAARDTDLYRLGAAILASNGALFLIHPTLGAIVQSLISVSSGSDPTQDFLQGRVATTNATVTTLFTMAIPASHACLLEVYVVARRTGGAAGTAEDCAAYHIRGLFNQVAGAAAIVAQLQTVIGESVAGYDAVFDVTGTDARVRVTGVASTNIAWHAHVFHRYLST